MHRVGIADLAQSLSRSQCLYCWPNTHVPLLDLARLVPSFFTLISLRLLSTLIQQWLNKRKHYPFH